MDEMQKHVELNRSDFQTLYNEKNFTINVIATVVISGIERMDPERACGSFQNKMVYMLLAEFIELHTMICAFCCM